MKTYLTILAILSCCSTTYGQELDSLLADFRLPWYLPVDRLDALINTDSTFILYNSLKFVRNCDTLYCDTARYGNNKVEMINVLIQSPDGIVMRAPYLLFNVEGFQLKRK